jgi:5-carboxymethyl-2-hydroxymuconate isomerase
MPHFIMDCSESVFGSHDEEYIIEQIHFVAHATGLLRAFRILCQPKLLNI